jgi:hypothetical protein
MIICRFFVDLVLSRESTQDQDDYCMKIIWVLEKDFTPAGILI